MKCANPQCGKEFKPNTTAQKYCCSYCCAVDYRRRRPKPPPKPPKTIEQWIKEANECKLDYGTYRAQVEHCGKTFEELKATAQSRVWQGHSTAHHGIKT